jgi:hypothetical protein
MVLCCDVTQRPVKLKNRVIFGCWLDSLAPDSLLGSSLEHRIWEINQYLLLEFKQRCEFTGHSRSNARAGGRPKLDT